jgi:predicted ester cyclase
MDAEGLHDFATRYTAAWCSQNPSNVAAFFEEKGSIAVNGVISEGRGAITAMVSGFMTAFPDLRLSMDRLDETADQIRYHWTFCGSNTGPDGTGKRVNFSGFEEWIFSDNGLIEKSLGHFNANEYQQQLERGSD